MKSTPVLLLIFNRPDTTRKVFEEIRRQQPKYLFIAADGPRADKAGDIRLCAEAREAVSGIDWDCEVKTLFRTANLGCGAAPAAAISWFFEHVAEGIILEDDCIPNASFFEFCGTLLEKYRADPRIMMICGTSYQAKALNADTYYFSRYPHAWGWATWSRAWAHYDFNLDGESELTRSAVVRHTFTHLRERKLWVHNLKHITNGLDAWDYQWMYWIWKNRGLCITPWKNMVSNIGFGPQATHTYDAGSAQARMTQHDLAGIRHPETVRVHAAAERYERFHILISSDRQYFRQRLSAAVARLQRIIFKRHGK